MGGGGRGRTMPLVKLIAIKSMPELIIFSRTTPLLVIALDDIRTFKPVRVNIGKFNHYKLN